MTRESTSGDVITIGDHIQHWSSTQTTIALSSGEAEYYGLISAVKASFGLQSALADLGLKFSLDVGYVPIEINMDSSAGIAIGSRRGLGKTKHIHTAFLWVQEMVTNQCVRLNKVGTKEMLADFLTKGVSQEILRYCMRGLNLYFRSGASKLALKA